MLEEAVKSPGVATLTILNQSKLLLSGERQAI